MTAWTLLRCDARLLDGPSPRICPAQFRTTTTGPDATREAATYGWTQMAERTDHPPITRQTFRCPDHRGHTNPTRPPGEVA